MTRICPLWLTHRSPIVTRRPSAKWCSPECQKAGGTNSVSVRGDVYDAISAEAKRRGTSTRAVVEAAVRPLIRPLNCRGPACSCGRCEDVA